MHKMTYQDVINDLEKEQDLQKAKILARFFKTGKGEYGEGDIFWGIVVPKTRKIAKKYKNISFGDLEKLLHHKVHEVRLTALLILVEKFREDPQKSYEIYLKNTKWINNWDLIDLTAEKIVGAYLKDKDKAILLKLTKSKSIWERRIAIMSTFCFIKDGKHEITLEIAERLLSDDHDLIQKAAGWMLREIGKRCSEEILLNFLDKYASQMPRVMLRYSIERLSEEKRQRYRKLKKMILSGDN